MKEQHEDPRTEVTFRYAGASRAGDDGVALVGNGVRDSVHLAGRLRDPVFFREAMSALYAVVGSDFRYVPKDRSAYLAFQRANRKTSVISQWAAQLQYFAWLERNDPMAWCILDPIVSVSDDEIAFEVFSKDESTYARLAVGLDAFELDGKPVCGTTNIDFSRDLMNGLQQLRSYRESRFEIGPDAVALKTEDAPEVLEKKVRVPDSWVRAFLQVQSAPTLPSAHVKMEAIDFYNVLRHLRMNADRKRQGRGLRIELLPGEPPRLVLEPWEKVLTTSSGPYKGTKAEVIRVWGRRRLMLARRLLPYVKTVEAHLLGTGLPSFWVLRAGPVTMTLGMTGFTASNWSQSVSFDLLLPRTTEASSLDAIEKTLAENPASLKDVTQAVGGKPSDVLATLQRGCQEGRLIYDVARDVYRHRPLLDEPLPLDRLAYRNSREREAYDLLGKKAVKLDKENRIHGSGIELTGKAMVQADQREYRPQLLIDDEGRLRRAECTCKHHRTHGLKEGPCSHLVALRVLYQRLVQVRLKARAGKRSAITVETRTYVRRRPRGEDVTMISLDQKRLRIQWGLRGEDLRTQNLVFNSVEAARNDYFQRVDRLESQGFLDASAG